MGTPKLYEVTRQEKAEPAPSKSAMTFSNPPSSRYRKLALKHHPLKSSDSASKEIFMQIAEAYDVLSDRE